MTKTGRFEPPRNTTEEDIPDIATGDNITICLKNMKEFVAWMVDMTDFIQNSGLHCRDCGEFPCHRNPCETNKIGYCYVESQKEAPV